MRCFPCELLILISIAFIKDTLLVKRRFVGTASVQSAPSGACASRIGDIRNRVFWCNGETLISATFSIARSNSTVTPTHHFGRLMKSNPLVSSRAKEQATQNAAPMPSRTVEIHRLRGEEQIVAVSVWALRRALCERCFVLFFARNVSSQLCLVASCDV